MAVVFSEVQEDYFLASIATNVFNDTELTVENDSDYTTYAETTFNIDWNSENSIGTKSITLEHCVSSRRELVGLQLWRGAFLLSDFLLSQPSLVTGKKVLELAAGTGLTAVTAGLMAESVTATDVDRGEILALLERNGKNNKDIMDMCKFAVKEIDFFWESWPEDIEAAVCESDVVLAADVVYDKEITKHFFKMLRKILNKSPKVAFIAIEKRLWTSTDGALVAPNFEFFLENLNNFHISRANENLTFKVREENTKFSQFFSYTRVKELTLWRIESVF